MFHIQEHRGISSTDVFLEMFHIQEMSTDVFRDVSYTRTSLKTDVFRETSLKTSVDISTDLFQMSLVFRDVKTSVCKTSVCLCFRCL